jgi:putrescine aminotransferase
LKLARLATGKSGIICTAGSWHGFTFGCLSISEQSMCRQFRPLLEGVSHVPYGNVAAIELALSDRVGCVIVEPIQSENGAVVPPTGYLKSLQELCAKRGVVLIFDEAKTGIAKTGRLFCCEYEGAVPDILVCGKALGGGVMPVGAVVARRTVGVNLDLVFHVKLFNR